MTDKRVETQIDEEKAGFAKSSRQCAQTICRMLGRKVLRCELALKMLNRALQLYGTRAGHQNYRNEYSLVRTMLADDKQSIPIDVIVFRLIRAIPVTKKNKRVLLKNLKRWKPDTKKWKSIPSMSNFISENSKNAARHIQTIIQMVESVDVKR